METGHEGTENISQAVAVSRSVREEKGKGAFSGFSSKSFLGFQLGALAGGIAAAYLSKDPTHVVPGMALGAGAGTTLGGITHAAMRLIKGD